MLINRDIVQKNHASGIPSHMSTDNVNLQNSEDIVQAFGSFLKRYLCNHILIQFQIMLLRTHPNISFQFQLPSVSEEIIFKTMRKLKTKFTSGPNGIPSFLSNDSASVLAAPVSVIFNPSLVSLKFPPVWKVFNICPIYKSGDKRELQN